jgi:chloride channel protein, CIC family
VVFVAETTGGHSFIIPSLFGAACAYAISGESSASADQRLHEVARFSGMMGVSVGEVMHREVVSVQASASLRDFAQSISARHPHAIFPVYDGDSALGTIAVWILSQIPSERWDQVRISEVCDRVTDRVPASCDLLEALRLLLRQDSRQMLLVGPPNGTIEGIVTKTDILRSLQGGSGQISHHRREDAE